MSVVRKKFRRPQHPIMRKIDDAINYLETHGYPVDVASVRQNAVGRISGRLMLTSFEEMLSPWVNTRLKARGYSVSDHETFDRKLTVEMTSSEFREQVLVRELHERGVRDRLKADHAVEKFLTAQRALLGREVTISEFEADIDKIYARFGY